MCPTHTYSVWLALEVLSACHTQQHIQSHVEQTEWRKVSRMFCLACLYLSDKVYSLQLTSTLHCPLMVTQVLKKLLTVRVFPWAPRFRWMAERAMGNWHKFLASTPHNTTHIIRCCYIPNSETHVCAHSGTLVPHPKVTRSSVEHAQFRKLWRLREGQIHFSFCNLPS